MLVRNARCSLRCEPRGPAIRLAYPALQTPGESELLLYVCVCAQREEIDAYHVGKAAKERGSHGVDSGVYSGCNFRANLADPNVVDIACNLYDK